MNYADYKKFDVINGEGLRHSLFVSGCTHACNGCFNASAWNFNYGKPFTKEVQEQIISDLKIDYVKIEGLSVLGGEPFQNIDGLCNFIERVKIECPNKSLWIWSGYTFEQIIKNEEKLRLLQMFDVLIDGKFVLEQKDLTKRWTGSNNQRVISVQESLLQNKVVLYEH